MQGLCKIRDLRAGDSCCLLAKYLEVDVRKVTDRYVYFYVINGAWEGTIDKWTNLMWANYYPDDTWSSSVINVWFGDLPSGQTWHTMAAYVEELQNRNLFGKLRYKLTYLVGRTKGALMSGFVPVMYWLGDCCILAGERLQGKESSSIRLAKLEKELQDDSIPF